MAHPILSLWLLVSWLDPHTCEASTPVTLRAPSFIFNNSQFAFSLYRQLAVPKRGRNVLFSPFSIAVPLTLLALQAKPESSYQILQDLGFSTREDVNTQAPTHYGQLLGALLPHPGECGVDTGSLLFMDKRLNPVQKFVSLAQSLYRTDVFLIALGNSEMAMDQIDSAMRDRTHGKIQKLLKELEPHSTLILANYIFFKGKWKHCFDPKLTEMRPFSLREGVTVLVPMMQRVGWFQLQHFPPLHSHVLRLPYSCNISAIFILPDLGRSQECEEALVGESFDTWIQPLPLSIQLDQLKHPAGSLNLFGRHVGLFGITLQVTPLRVSKTHSGSTNGSPQCSMKSKETVNNNASTVLGMAVFPR
ncbi:alpha-1-antitrypsin-like [Nannospalax galili]|uniref:alpha-1-antitrypsin-like n=1 Tax=Nannospalax galili TaxID=1026970 RepID=UPI00111C5FEE|nr:alpha-1-antitrypsin-like [Nannospalax galili]